MSCSSGGGQNITVPEVNGSMDITELLKVSSLEEANRLLQEGLVFLAVFYNQSLGSEEYVLGKTRGQKETTRPIGFKR